MTMEVAANVIRMGAFMVLGFHPCLHFGETLLAEIALLAYHNKTTSCVNATYHHFVMLVLSSDVDTIDCWCSCHPNSILEKTEIAAVF